MILTKCAYCAAPNAVTKCGHCKTRYCGRDCQKLHWKGGHRAICQEIKRGGGAERYHANKKYTEISAVAVEKCAEDTKGQTCYICLEDGSEEGLVRGCSCRGGSGFAHVSCLAEQAKTLVAKGEEIHLPVKEGWARWVTCGMCKQNYHGVVMCALGWACWKTYVGRPETDPARGVAMNNLGNGLMLADQFAEALSVQEAELSRLRRLGGPEEQILAVQSNIASTYLKLEKPEQALPLRRLVYSRWLELKGEEDEGCLLAASNFADSLGDLERFEEAKTLYREIIPVALRVLGEDAQLTIKMRVNFAHTLLKDYDTEPDELREAVTTLEETEPIARRVLGGAHPWLGWIEELSQVVRECLRRKRLQQGMNARVGAPSS